MAARLTVDARRSTPARLLVPLVAVGALGSFLVGVEAGLDRLGVGVVPATAAALPHGALMVNGFVATVVSVERARASSRVEAYAIPLSSAAGGGLLLAGQDLAARGLFVASALGLALLMWWFWRKQPQLPLAVVAIGALAWAGGGVTWLVTDSVVRAIPWWGVYLVLTILGERLELTRFARRSVKPVQAAAVVSLGALAVTAWDWEAGTRLVGLSFLVTGAWLLWADTARRTITRGGVASYAGAALLAAYAWLLVAGLLLARDGLLGRSYDASLHALFVGFVMGSIFAHGPIVLPALTGRGVRLTAILVAALAVLHASVILRVAAGVAGEPAWREVAGATHAVAFALYIAGMLVGVLLDARETRDARAPRQTAGATGGLDDAGGTG